MSDVHGMPERAGEESWKIIPGPWGQNTFYVQMHIQGETKTVKVVPSSDRDKETASEIFRNENELRKLAQEIYEQQSKESSRSITHFIKGQKGEMEAGKGGWLTGLFAGKKKVKETETAVQFNVEEVPQRSPKKTTPPKPTPLPIDMGEEEVRFLEPGATPTPLPIEDEEFQREVAERTARVSSERLQRSDAEKSKAEYNRGVREGESGLRARLQVQKPLTLDQAEAIFEKSKKDFEASHLHQLHHFLETAKPTNEAEKKRVLELHGKVLKASVERDFLSVKPFKMEEVAKMPPERIATLCSMLMARALYAVDIQTRKVAQEQATKILQLVDDSSLPALEEVNKRSPGLLRTFQDIFPLAPVKEGLKPQEVAYEIGRSQALIATLCSGATSFGMLQRVRDELARMNGILSRNPVNDEVTIEALQKAREAVQAAYSRFSPVVEMAQELIGEDALISVDQQNAKQKLRQAIVKEIDPTAAMNAARLLLSRKGG